MPYAVTEKRVVYSLQYNGSRVQPLRRPVVVITPPVVAFDAATAPCTLLICSFACLSKAHHVIHYCHSHAFVLVLLRHGFANVIVVDCSRSRYYHVSASHLVRRRTCTHSLTHTHTHRYPKGLSSQCDTASPVSPRQEDKKRQRQRQSRRSGCKRGRTSSHRLSI